MLEKDRKEPTQSAVPFGRADQRILHRQRGQGLDTRAGGLNLPPADLRVDPLHDIAAILERLVDGADHASEHSHDLADFAATGLERALAAAAAPGEQRADQPVEGVHCGIAQALFQLDKLCRYGRAPTPDAVAAEEEGRRHSTFAGELLKASLVDLARDLRVDADRPDIGQPFDDLGHGCRVRRFGNLPQPGQP